MNNCCNKCDCDPCKKKCCEPVCGCPTQILGITTVHDDTPAWLRWNLGGKSVDYDLTSAVKSAETDTTMRLDLANRSFIYNAEKHTDSFTASELGSMLHIADIGDVDITGIGDNAIFVYQKNSDCGEGCEGINNSWVAHNPLESKNLVSNMKYVMGFDSNGKPKTLNSPVQTAKQHLLGWDKSGKVQYIDLKDFGSTPPNDGTYKYHVYLDPNTGELGYVKEHI